MHTELMSKAGIANYTPEIALLQIPVEMHKVLE